jgi:hypothetical protein
MIARRSPATSSPDGRRPDPATLAVHTLGPFGLAGIRAVLDELDQELAAYEQEREPTERTSSACRSRRRLGGGSLEAKFIRGYGPYQYYLFR